jgi:hypothetical protein
MTALSYEATEVEQDAGFLVVLGLVLKDLALPLFQLGAN